MNLQTPNRKMKGGTFFLSHHCRTNDAQFFRTSSFEYSYTPPLPPGDMVAEAKFCLSQHPKEKVCCLQKSLGEERFPTKLAVVHPRSEGKSPNLKTDGTFAEGVRSVGEGREGKGSK